MIYPFECPSCDKYDEVIRPHTEAHLPVQCPDCGTIMDRVWGGHGVKISDTTSWNPGLGCRQGQVKEKLKRLKEDREVVTRDVHGNIKRHVVKGIELHETGNERVAPKPKRSDYSLNSKEHFEIGKILNG